MRNKDQIAKTLVFDYSLSSQIFTIEGPTVVEVDRIAEQKARAMGIQSINNLY